MKFFISWFSLLIILMFFSIVNAQESGEMLRFDKKPNLKMELTRSTLQKSTGGVLYESPINEKSSKPFNRVFFNGTLAVYVWKSQNPNEQIPTSFLGD